MARYNAAGDSIGEEGTWYKDNGGNEVEVTPASPLPVTASSVAGNTTPADAQANPTTAVPVENFPMTWNGATWDRWRSGQTNGGPVGTPAVVIGDGGAGSTRQAPVNNGVDGVGYLTAALVTQSLTYAYDGTANFDRVRYPKIFKTVVATTSGNTALWTPAAGKKFRLMRYLVSVPYNAASAAPGNLLVDLLDAAASIAQTHTLFIPATGQTTGGPPIYHSGWIDLGNGILSATANNVLNINLNAAFAAGVVRVLCCGTEE